MRLHKENSAHPEDESATETGDLVDENGKKYELPLTGILKITVTQKSIPPPASEVLDDDKVENILNTLNSKAISNEVKEQIIVVCSKEMVFSSTHIDGFLKVSKNDINMKMNLIASIIPRVHDQENIQKALEQSLNANEKKVLHKTLGSYLKLRDNNLTGHYVLHLHKKIN